MLALRRVALRALSRSPSFATPSPARAPVPLTISRALRPTPVACFQLNRRCYSEEARPVPPVEEQAEEEIEEEEAYSQQSPPTERQRDHYSARPSSLPTRPPPPQDVTPSKVVYVGNLFYDITDADLHREFEKIAPVKSCRVVFDRRGLSKGHGYVEYETVDDAQRAVETMNQQLFEGRRMVVNYQIATPTPRRSYHMRSDQPSRTLFIGNMSYEMTDQDLNDLFRDIRNVVDVRVAIDRRTGTPKGFAHADFVDVQSAENAIRILEQKTIYGRQLRVDFSESNRSQQASQVRSPASEAPGEQVE